MNTTPYYKNVFHQELMHSMIHRKESEVLEILKKEDINYNYKNNHGWTILSWAIQHKMKKIALYL